MGVLTVRINDCTEQDAQTFASLIQVTVGVEMAPSPFQKQRLRIQSLYTTATAVVWHVQRSGHARPQQLYAGMQLKHKH